MAFKMELRKGGEPHYKAVRQARYFVGAFILCIVLFAVGCFNDARFFDYAGILFVVLWVSCLALAFNGAVCEVYAEKFPSAIKPWYGISAVLGLGVPLVSSVVAGVMTGSLAYLLVFVVAAYFVVRNHRLVRAATKKDLS